MYKIEYFSESVILVDSNPLKGMNILNELYWIIELIHVGDSNFLYNQRRREK